MFYTDLVSAPTPAGVAATSRGLSEAMPPETLRQFSRTRSSRSRLTIRLALIAEFVADDFAGKGVARWHPSGGADFSSVKTIGI